MSIDDKFRDVDDATTERRPLPLPPPDETPPDIKPVLPPSGFPEDPPELKARLVSAIGGECSDLSLMPARFEQFASKTEQALKTLAEGMKLLNESVLPLIALQGKRIDEGHREHIALAGRLDRNDAHDDRQDARLDAVEAELAALRKLPSKAPTTAQRPKKRAGRKNVR